MGKVKKKRTTSGRFPLERYEYRRAVPVDTVDVGVEGDDGRLVDFAFFQRQIHLRHFLGDDGTEHAPPRALIIIEMNRVPAGAQSGDSTSNYLLDDVDDVAVDAVTWLGWSPR